MDEWMSRQISKPSSADQDALFIHGHKMASWPSKSMPHQRHTSRSQDCLRIGKVQSPWRVGKIHIYPYHIFLVLFLEWNIKFSLLKNHEIEGIISNIFLPFAYTIICKDVKGRKPLSLGNSLVHGIFWQWKRAGVIDSYFGGEKEQPCLFHCMVMALWLFLQFLSVLIGLFLCL